MKIQNYSVSVFRPTHLLIVVFILLVSVFTSSAQYLNVPVTGFNNDLVANGVGTNSIVGTSFPTIGVDGAGYSLIDNTFKYVSTNALPACFMPVSNNAASLRTPGLTYVFQSYTANNALTIDNNSTTYLSSPFPNSGSLTLSTPASFAKLRVLYESVMNIAGLTVDVTVTYTDATVESFPGNALVNWFTATNPAFNSFGRSSPTGGIECGSTPTFFPNMFELQFDLNAANFGKQVASIGFTLPANMTSGTTPTSVNYFHALAVGGIAPCVAPPADQPSALVLSSTSGSVIDGSFTAAPSSPPSYLTVAYLAGSTATPPVAGTVYALGSSLGSGKVVGVGASTSFTATGLYPSLSYDFYVYAFGNGSCYNTALPLFGTQAVSSVGSSLLINPFAEGGFQLGTTFADNGWTLTNSPTGVNRWFLGVPPITGLPSGYTDRLAYVSSDLLGANNNYDIGSSSASHFYRDVTIPTAQTNLSLTFNWSGNGESSWDMIMVSVAPTSVVPAGGIHPGSGFVLNGVPGSVIIGTFQLQTTRQSATVSIPMSALIAAGINPCSGPATIRLIFTWKSDTSIGTSPAGSVDNIALVSTLNTTSSAASPFTIDNTQPTSGTNFNNFTAAINWLNTACVSNPVVFNVTSGQTFVENPPAILNTGTVVNTITFQKSGVLANPVIVPNGAPAVSTGDWGLCISGGDFITIDGIDINSSAVTSVEFGYLVRNITASNGATNNVIKNCTITLNRILTTSRGILQTSSTVGGGFLATTLSGTNSNNQYLNLVIKNCYAGIYLLGGTTDPFIDANNTIGTTSCSIFNLIGDPAVANDIGNSTTQTWGIRAGAQAGVNIFNNKVTNVTHTSTAVTDGIFIDNTGSLTYSLGTFNVYNNIVSTIRNTSTSTANGILSGIKVNTTTSPTTTAYIYNNLVYNLQQTVSVPTTTVRRVIGIYAQQSGSGAGSIQNYDHNTVHLNHTNLAVSNACFEIGTATGPVFNVRSNNLTNFTGNQAGVNAKHYCIVTTSATQFGNTGSTSNNNNLYVTNNQGFIGLASTTDRVALSGGTNPWNLISAGGSGSVDANSVSVDPLYFDAANNDYHVISGFLNLSGSGSDLWNSSDLDCNSRASFTPNDIGAYAFTPPAIDMGVAALVAPNTGTCHTAAENVIVRVRNFASGTIDFSIDPITVSVTVSGVGSDFITTVVNTGTLAPGATLDVIVGQTNTVTTGLYTFASSVSVAFDAVAANNSRSDNLTKANFTVSVSGPASGAICTGASTLLSVVPLNQANPVTYSWSPATGLSATSGASVTANPTSSIVYTVTGTDNCLNSAFNTFALTVNTLPVISVTPTSAQFCGTLPAAYSLTASGNANTYAWLPTAGLNVSTGTVVSANPAGTTTYTVTGTLTATGCTNFATAVLTRFGGVSVTGSATPNNVCIGANSQLNAVAIEGTAPATFYSRTVTSGGTYTALSGPGITIINTNAQLTSGMGSTNQDDGGVVIPIPFSFNFLGNSFSTMSMCTNGWIGAGNHGTIDASSMRISGNLFTATIPNNTIAAWFKDMGANFPTGTGSMRHGIIAPDVYAFQWNNANGSGFGDGSTILISFQINIFGPTSSNPGRIQYLYGPTVGTIAASASIGLEDAVGGTNRYLNAVTGNGTTTTLATAWPGNGSGYIFDPIPAGLSYAWSPPTFLSSTNISNPVATNVTASTNYTVTATALSGCTATAVVPVISGALTSNITSNDNVSCAAQSVILTANVPSGAGPYTYAWSTGATTSSITVAPTVTTNYTVTVSNGCADAATASFIQTVEPVPVLNLNNDYSVICYGSGTIVPLIATGDGTSYVWSPAAGLDATTGSTVNVSGLTNSRTYTVVSTLGNCTTTKTAKVKVPGPIYTYASATPPAVCAGGVSILNAATKTTASYFATAETPSPVAAPGSGITTLNSLTPMTGGNTNNGFWQVTLPFRASFFDEGYDNIFIGTNGYVSFPQGYTEAVPTTMPSATSPNGAISLAMKDWTLAASGSIQYFTLGTAPNRIFVVKYLNVPPVSGTGLLNGQIELYESGDIALFLQSTDASSLKTLGIESTDGFGFHSFSSRNGVAWTASQPEMWKFSAQGGSFTYSWSPTFEVLDATVANTPTTPLFILPDTFHVEVNDSTGCTNRDTAIVILGVGMIVNILASPNDTVCFGTPLTLTAQILGGSPPYTFTWDDGVSTVGTNSTLQVTPPAGTTTYGLSVTDGCNPDPGVGSLAILVNPLPVVSVTASPVLPGGGGVACGNDSATLVASSPTSISFAWSPSAGLNTTLGNTVKARPLILNTTTIYTVTGTDIKGCQASASSPVKRAFPVTNVATAIPSNICVGANSQLLSDAKLSANNYVISPIPYAPPSPSSGVTVLQSGGAIVTPLFSGSLDDGTWGNIPLPAGFVFNFYGQNKTAISVSTNGFLSFTANNTLNGCCSGQALPNATTPNDVVAYGWEDWNHTAGTMDYFTTGSAPFRKFVVRAQGIPRFGATGAPSTVMAVLNETFNTVDVFITSIVCGAGDITTLGIENSTGTVGVTVTGRNAVAGWTASNEGWRFEFPSAGISYAWSPATFLSSTNIFNPVATAVTATTTYSVIATSGDGCAAPASVTVNVSPLVVDSISSNKTSVCQDASIVLTAHASGGGSPYTYAWFDNGNPIGTNSNTVSVTSLIAGNHTYTVVVTDICGGSTNLTRDINTIARPPVAVTTSGDICGTIPATLTATGANTYAWSPTTNLTPVTGAVVTANPSISTMYTVVGTSTSTGCSASATIFQWVHLLPTISATATPNPILLNANTQLNATANQNSNYGYLVSSIPFAPVTPSGAPTVLQNNGVAITPLTVGSMDDGTWSNINLPAGFAFNFFGQNKTGISVSTNGFLTFTAASTLSGCCSGQLLPSTATPNDVIAYGWEDWNQTAGSTDYFTLGSAPFRQFVLRSQGVPRFGGTGAPSTVMVILNETVNTVEIHITSITSGTGDFTTLGIENSTGTLGLAVAGRNSVAGWAASNEGWLFAPVIFGAPVFNYAWSPPTFLSSTSIANPMANSVSAVITYTVSVTNATTGCTSTPATIQVLAGVPLAVSINSPTNAICLGQNITLNSTVSGGGVPYAYNWSDGVNDVGSAPSITVSPTVTTAYTLTITDVGNNTLSSTPFTVIVNPLPVITVTPPGGSICNSSTGITMTASGNSGSYTWSPAAGLSSTTSATVTATPTSTTNYVATGIISATGCTNTSLVTVYKVQLATTASAIPPNVCFEQNGQLKAVSQIVTSTYCQPVTSCTFPDIISNVTFAGINRNSACDGASTGGFTLYSTPSPTLIAGSVGIPISITTSGDVEGVAAWIDFNQDGQFSASELLLNGYQGVNPATYTALVNVPANSLNGTTRLRVRCLFANDPLILADPPCSPSTFGETEDYLLNIAGGIGAGLPVVWTPSIYLNDSSLTDPTITAIKATTIYTVTVTEPISGCTLSDTAKVTVIPLPTLALSGTGVACEGGTANLTFNFTGTAPFTYSYTNGISNFGPFTSPTSTAVVAVSPPGVPGEVITYTPLSVSDARCNGTATEISGSAVLTIVSLSDLGGVTFTSNKPFDNICQGDNIALTLNGISTHTLGYQAHWKWYRAGCGTSGGGTLIASDVTTLTVSPTTTTTYYVRAEGYCNTTSCLSVTVVVSTNSVNGNPTIIYSPVIAFAGASDSIVVNAVPGATFYRWSSGGNSQMLFDGHPSPWQTTSPKVMLTFVNPSTQGSGIGNYHISFFAGNACGRTNNNTIQIRSTVSPPAELNGPNVACAGQTRTYSVPSITGAKSYEWSLTPSSAGTITGQGTATVSITFNSLPASLCVHGVTAFNSDGPDLCMNITTNILVPGTVSGDTLPCQGSSSVYSISPVTGAIDYIWTTTVPGATISDSGTYATVTFPMGTFSGTVCVQANSGCSLSPTSCLNISNGAPTPVGTISGIASGLCGVTSVNYQVPSTGATSYTWVVPAGANIMFGQGTNSILVDFTNSFGSGNITVTASNACGIVNGSLPVTGAPTAPNITPDAPTACAGEAVGYTAAANGATSYN